MNLSVIVTTYNRPDALACILKSLAGQNIPPYEVIIADDGSSEDTAACIIEWRRRLPCPLHHVWQPDAGFRAAMARNRAAAKAAGEYLVFLDGDCIVFPDFIAQHMALAQSGCFVAGNRLLLDEGITRSILLKAVDPTGWTNWQWLLARRRGNVNRLLPLLRIAGSTWRLHRPTQWRGVRTCNLGLWRKDLLGVNGFDESFAGWGHEDADLAVRLIRFGVRRKDGQFAIPVLHLWHAENPRGLEQENYARLLATLSGERDLRSLRGIDQYLANESR